MQLLSNRTTWCCTTHEAASSPTLLIAMPEGKNNTLSTVKANTRSSSSAEQTDVLDRQQEKVYENRTHLANPFHWFTVAAYITTLPSPNLSSSALPPLCLLSFQVARYVLLYPFANHLRSVSPKHVQHVYLDQKHLRLRPQEYLRPHRPMRLISCTKRLYNFETGRHPQALQMP